MHILNYFFTPFGIALILFAIFFSQPEKDITYISLFILLIQFLTNFYISKNIYKFSHMQKVRTALVLFNIITTIFIFYFLSPYWAPMWLLFIIPPATASMFMKKTGTFLTALFSALSMMGVYAFRSYVIDAEMPLQLIAMASCQALFIVAFSMFLNSMSNMIVKMRDNLAKRI